MSKIPDNDMKVIINHDIETATSVFQYPLIPSELTDFKKENNRVSVDYQNYSYSFVFDEKTPKVEVREICHNGELGRMIYNLEIPRL